MLVLFLLKRLRSYVLLRSIYTSLSKKDFSFYITGTFRNNPFLTHSNAGFYEINLTEIFKISSKEISFPV